MYQSSFRTHNLNANVSPPQFIRRYNAWEMMRQAERASEEERRSRMYGFPSAVFASLTQGTAFTRGWKPSATINET